MVSRQQQKLLDANKLICDEPDTPANEKAFLARQLVQVTLPHDDPGDVPVWQRRNGNLSMGIRSGWDYENNKPIGYPYGTIPRLLLFWITTEALRKKERRLEIGNSVSEFMRALGLNHQNGGIRSDRKRLENQMERLFKARIIFNRHEQQGNAKGESWADISIAEKGELWWDLSKPQQPGLFNSWIELGESFYQTIKASPVPVDLRALRVLKNSSLALDLYAWSTYRTFTITRRGQEQFISWTALSKQLGGDYTRPRRFKEKAREALRKVQLVYPALRTEELIEKNVSKGLVIKPSQTAVKSR
ncbi:plasmid encoded RepA protein (plasmid) [Thalassoporum mexicanum PCC 7367]|uniref:replication protein RepA n=1 Tax=Thalassoporum mexicanum TaxID=3457544 RepID=UPI00029FD581|nr:replication protein RepA [Pseudanabaena sp. PCC 7367]AFY71964.1 plasmid encoded RepA protein [Pseudanabaena sp. PCC 7367]